MGTAVPRWDTCLTPATSPESSLQHWPPSPSGEQRLNALSDPDLHWDVAFAWACTLRHIENMRKDQQAYAVSAGLALGLAIASHQTIQGGKPALDSAFSRAWRSWRPRGRFPSVDRAAQGMQFSVYQWTSTTRTRGQRFNSYVYWEDGWPLTVVVRHLDDDPTNAEDQAYAASTISGFVTAAEWATLAESFLAALTGPPLATGASGA